MKSILFYRTKLSKKLIGKKLFTGTRTVEHPCYITQRVLNYRMFSIHDNVDKESSRIYCHDVYTIVVIVIHPNDVIIVFVRV